MGIRGSKSKSVDITTPGSELPSPSEAKASANGGTDLQEYHDKKLENGDQVAPAVVVVVEGDDSDKQSEVKEGENATAPKVSDSTNRETNTSDGSTSQEPEPVKENGGVDAKGEEDDVAAKAVAPIANEEKVDSATDGETVERKDEEHAEDKKKKEKSKEESRKEKKEEEKRRKEEERKRKEEEKKRKEEEKKEKKKDKKRSFSFLQKKKKKEENVVNGEVEFKDAKEEGKEEGNAESAEQPFESEIQTKDLDESAVSETKQESSILESSVANETADEATEPEVEVKAELQQEEKVPEVVTEKEPEVDEKSHVEVEESNKVVADVVEAVTVNVEVQEVAASVPKNETEITSKDESSEAHTETSPVKQIPESTVPETEVEVTPQHPAISTVLDEIPPPPPTPPLVNEAPVEPQQTEVEPEVEQRLTESVKESDVPPPLPPTPPPVIESTPSVPTECEPETRTEQITDDIVPPPPPPVESDEVKQMSHPPPQVDVAPSPPPVLPEEPLVEDSAAIEKVDVEPVQIETSFPTELVWQHGGKQVAILGSFNNWTEPVQLLERDGVFATKLNLNDGEHYLKFQVDGDWTTDKNLPVVNLDGQGEVNVLLVKGEASEE